MKTKFQSLEAFHEEELFAIVESIFSEFLIKLLEKKKYSYLRNLLFGSGKDSTFSENSIKGNRPPSKTMVAANKISKVKLYVEENYGRVGYGDNLYHRVQYPCHFNEVFKKKRG